MENTFGKNKHLFKYFALSVIKNYILNICFYQFIYLINCFIYYMINTPIAKTESISFISKEILVTEPDYISELNNEKKRIGLHKLVSKMNKNSHLQLDYNIDSFIQDSK